MGYTPSQHFSPAADELILQPGTRLLHIGPFKTGTSALQGAFAQSRDALADKGVIYPAGALRHWLRPTIALAETLSIRGHPKAEPRHWQQLVDAFEQAGDNTVLHSCEFFSDCEPEHIERAVRELGGSHPVHVVITVRPLLKLLPSQWQMHIQDGWIHTPYETWLRQLFDVEPIEPDDPTARFWHRHDHAQLAARWAEVVGPSNVTVIVPDPKDRFSILRPFDALLGLPQGFLEFEPGHVNESLRYGSAELLRRINQEFVEREWSDADYGRLIRNGATARMRAGHEPLPVEHPARTPRWAQKHAIEIGERIADNLGELGIRVVGDLENLRAEPEPEQSAATEADAAALVAAEAASQFTIGVIEIQQEQASKLKSSLEKTRERARKAEGRVAEEQRAKQKLASELAAAKKALDPAQPEHRRTIDVDSLTLLRFVARRVVGRARRRLQTLTGR